MTIAKYNAAGLDENSSGTLDPPRLACKKTESTSFPLPSSHSKGMAKAMPLTPLAN